MEVERTGENGERRKTTEQPPLRNPLMAEERRKKRPTVMVAVDESDMSLYALKWTVENLFNKPAAVAVSPTPATGEQIPLAEPDPDPEPEHGMITVAHVIQPFERYAIPSEASMYVSSAMVESVRRAQRQNASALLSRALKVCKEMKGFPIPIPGQLLGDSPVKRGQVSGSSRVWSFLSSLYMTLCI
ncbi:uncharacterized protein LOC112519537 isoform X2 [Cynara cardunculus var. scolymus]|uniref:uncharacterized protein LOC112519537 isoform X2 n=1 Tax=Cynara cardunculus var. scolymus TaxID=59895 RepID=UPI000D62AA32|nr:uncharacterized protein LOC112519537 isoform X2 [Cynara cardunculus var. scolymus]